MVVDAVPLAGFGQIFAVVEDVLEGLLATVSVDGQLCEEGTKLEADHSQRQVSKVTQSYDLQIWKKPDRPNQITLLYVIVGLLTATL